MRLSKNLLDSLLQFLVSENLFCTLGYHNYICSLYSFLVVANFKLYDLTLSEGFESLCHDARVVYKYFRPSSVSMKPYPFLLSNHLTLPIIQVKFNFY